MTRAATKLITAEDLERDYNDVRCELIDGVVHTMSPSGRDHGELAAEFIWLLGNWNKKHKLGKVYGTETGFKIGTDPDTVRAPDAAFVRGRAERAGRSSFAAGAPDVAVEVISDSDTPRYVDEKARQWIEAGSKLVWVVWPQTKSVTEYRADGSTHILHESDELDGGDVLPGFRCRVGAIFE